MTAEILENSDRQGCSGTVLSSRHGEGWTEESWLWDSAGILFATWGSLPWPLARPRGPVAWKGQQEWLSSVPSPSRQPLTKRREMPAEMAPGVSPRGYKLRWQGWQAVGSSASFSS